MQRRSIPPLAAVSAAIAIPPALMTPAFFTRATRSAAVREGMGCHASASQRGKATQEPVSSRAP